MQIIASQFGNQKYNNDFSDCNLCLLVLMLAVLRLFLEFVEVELVVEYLGFVI